MENVNRLLAEVDEFSLLVIFLWPGYTQPPPRSLPSPRIHTHLIILKKERSRVAQRKQRHYCPAIGWLCEWKLLLLFLNP